MEYCYVHIRPIRIYTHHFGNPVVRIIKVLLIMTVMKWNKTEIEIVSE